METIAGAERLCKRFGPGRLPGAESRAVGGGYAVAPSATFDIVGAGGLTAVIGAVGFVYTCWLTLPLGAVSGYIHERAVRFE